MNRVQHQTKKKKVFVDNKNSAFSQRGTDDASESSSNNNTTTNAPSEQQHQQKQKKPMAFKKVNNNAPSSSTSISSNISSSENVSNSATNKFSCCICCEEASVRTIFQTCNHSDVCHKCTLKLRVLNNDNRCCVCKNASECVIFSQRQNIKPFSEYTKDDLVYDETWKVYTDDYLLMNDITSLRRIECRLCKDSGVTLTFENSNVLNNHMNEVHKLNYCSYCLASRKVFLCEQKLYNWSNLMKHIKFGEEDPNYGKIEGHPLCKFCNVRFYSDDEIFDHMYKRHERCFICQKHGVQFEFYQDYKHLERHFDQKHFLCPHSECREEGFKVYENELELMAHKNRYHSSATSTSKKSKTQKLDLSTLSTTTHLPTDDERRQVRTGEINSSIIRFVDTAGDGYHNDNIHNKQPGQSSSGNKKQKQKKEKESSSDFKEKNNQLVKKMKELLTENQFQDLKVLSSQFLRGDTLASEYYSRVISMLGEEKTKEVFDLMVEAIPPQDENKKKALLLARNTYHSAEFNPNLGKEDANASSPQSSSNGTTPQNWPTLNNGNNNKSKSSDPNWNPQNPQPTPNQQPKKKKGPTLAHNVTRAPDLLWGVQNSTAPAGLNKEMEFPTLPTTPTPSSSKNAKKTNSNWTKPLKEEKQNSNNPYSEFGNIKVYKFSETKKKKNK